MEFKRNIYKLTYLQNRKRLIDIENRLWLPKEKAVGGINSELGITIHTLLYIKQIVARTYYTAQGTLFSILC